MRAAVTGASGLIGLALVSALRVDGHDVLRLVRSTPAHPDEAHWDPVAGVIDARALEGIDAAVHLAGANVFRRWTRSGKDAIMNSRAEGTRLFSQTLAALGRPPRVLVSASGVGFYGAQRDELLTEESAAGTGFLGEVCRAWEEATSPASAAGIRVVNLRLGIVMSARGGALATMLPPFRLGLGGVTGRGERWLSWLSLDDAAGIIGHALNNEALRGPVNAVAPVPVTNREFTRTLARVLRRPAVLPLPPIALRLALGEMADEVPLSSLRVEPVRLRASGYVFKHPDLEGALRAALGT